MLSPKAGLGNCCLLPVLMLAGLASSLLFSATLGSLQLSCSWHRRMKQGSEGGGRPPRFFGLTESFESRSRVK